jgi:hypothetical protein
MPTKLRLDPPFYDLALLNTSCLGTQVNPDLLADEAVQVSDEFWELITKVFRLSVEKRFGDELKRR